MEEEERVFRSETRLSRPVICEFRCNFIYWIRLAVYALVIAVVSAGK